VRHALGTLLFASLICVLLWGMRGFWAHGMRFSGFIWNLFLAWIPLVLALKLRDRERADTKFWLLGVAWLLFFPNSFYIVTDLVHVKKFGTDHLPVWYDVLMTAAFACVGLLLGALSLYVLHLRVRARYGWPRGWLFAGSALLLGSVGVYLGRFSRLNSWDVIARPLHLLDKVSKVAEPEKARPVAFIVAFFFFSLAVYACVVSMARIHEIEEET
jgi:uncharacterized membrane protein